MSQTTDERDPIRAYLAANGSTYTEEALRQALIQSGHDPAAIDAGIAAWKADRQAGAAERARFGRWALAFHVGALVVMVGVILVIKGTTGSGLLFLGAGILAVALLIGWWLTGLIGRAMLPRTGLVIALVAPLLSAVVLGGVCLGLMNAAISTPPRSGQVELTLTAPEPVAFSGGAACYLENAYPSIYSQDLGEWDGGTVTASVYVYGSSDEEVMVTVRTYDMQQNVGRNWSSPPASMSVSISADGRTGEVEFVDLPPEAESAIAGLQPLSGTISWQCE